MDFKFIRNVTLNGKVVGKIGVVDGVKSYVSTRRPEHFFRIYNGFGIDKNILWEISEEGVIQVIIYYVGKNEHHYVSLIDDWFENSTSTDYGHGEQMILSKDFMNEP